MCAYRDDTDVAQHARKRNEGDQSISLTPAKQIIARQQISRREMKRHGAPPRPPQAAATHRLHVETRPLARAWHRKQRKRVPFVGADSGAVDLDVGAGLVLVPPARGAGRPSPAQRKGRGPGTGLGGECRSTTRVRLGLSVIVRPTTEGRKHVAFTGVAAVQSNKGEELPRQN